MNHITHIPERKQIIITVDSDENYTLCKNVLPEFLNYYNFNVIERNNSQVDFKYLEEHEKNIIKIERVIDKWYNGELTEGELKNKKYTELKKEGIIPLQYLQQRSPASLKYIDDFKSTIESLISSGVLIQVGYIERERLRTKYKWSRFDAEAFTRGEHKRFKVCK